MPPRTPERRDSPPSLAARDVESSYLLLKGMSIQDRTAYFLDLLEKKPSVAKQQLVDLGYKLGSREKLQAFYGLSDDEFPTDVELHAPKE